jgi:hypothetical protein
MDISSEGIHAWMALWGRLGGLSRSERKRMASQRNLALYRQRAAAMPLQAADAGGQPVPVLFFPIRKDDNADA